jgi:hypothetical protein
MKGLASSTGLPSSSNFASRHQLCSGLVAILLAILLLELGLIHGPSIQVPSSKQPFSSGNAITNLPQGPDQQLWNMQAQQVGKLAAPCFLSSHLCFRGCASLHILGLVGL